VFSQVCHNYNLRITKYNHHCPLKKRKQYKEGRDKPGLRWCCCHQRITIVAGDNISATAEELGIKLKPIL